MILCVQMGAPPLLERKKCKHSKQPARQNDHFDKFPTHLVHDRRKFVLGRDKRSLVGISRPFASPFTCNGVKGHIWGDVNLQDAGVSAICL